MRAHKEILAHIDSGVYHRVDLTQEVHRSAERLLIAIQSVALRASDALHLALALDAGADGIVTYDQRMAAASQAGGLRAFSVPK